MGGLLFGSVYHMHIKDIRCLFCVICLTLMFVNTFSMTTHNTHALIIVNSCVCANIEPASAVEIKPSPPPHSCSSQRRTSPRRRSNRGWCRTCSTSWTGSPVCQGWAVGGGVAQPIPPAVLVFGLFVAEGFPTTDATERIHSGARGK